MARDNGSADAQLKDLISRLADLVETARREGRERALADVRELVSGGAKPAKKAKAKAAPADAADEKKAKKTRAKSKTPRKNPWADLSPEQRLARINAIRKGRGLEPREA